MSEPRLPVPGAPAIKEALARYEEKIGRKLSAEEEGTLTAMLGDSRVIMQANEYTAAFQRRIRKVSDLRAAMINGAMIDETCQLSVKDCIQSRPAEAIEVLGKERDYDFNFGDPRYSDMALSKLTRYLDAVENAHREFEDRQNDLELSAINAARHTIEKKYGSVVASPGNEFMELREHMNRAIRCIAMEGALPAFIKPPHRQVQLEDDFTATEPPFTPDIISQVQAALAGHGSIAQAPALLPRRMAKTALSCA